MTDPISVTASIAGLIALGNTISQTIQFIRSSSEHVQALSDELDDLCILLDRLQTTFANVPRHELLWRYLKHVLTSCMERLQQLELLVKTYRVGVADGPMSQIWAQWRWNSREKEIIALKSQLEGYKSTLNITLLLSAHSETAAAADTSRRIETQVQEVLELLRRERDPGGGSYMLERYISSTSSIMSTSPPRTPSDGVSAAFTHRWEPISEGTWGYEHPEPPHNPTKEDEISCVIESDKRKMDASDWGHQFGSGGYTAATSEHVERVLEPSGQIPDKPPRLHPRNMLDAGEDQVPDLIESKTNKGQLSSAEKRVGKVQAGVMAAIWSRNKTKLTWCLNIASRVVWVAIHLGSESFLDSLVRAGATIAQEAAARHYREGLKLMTKACAKALVTAIHEGKASCVQRLLLVSSQDFKALVADEKYTEAKHLLEAATELFVQTCKVGTQQLVEMTANVSAETFDSLLDGPFKEYLLQIVEEYGARWVAAVERRDARDVRAIGKAGFEQLLAAAGHGKPKRLLGEFVPTYVALLEMVFDPEQPDIEKWLLHEGLGGPISHLVFKKQGQELAENMVIVGIEFLLFIAQDRRPDCIRGILLGLGTELLRAIDSAGHLKSIEAMFGKLVDEKFNAIDPVNHHGLDQLDDLQEQFLGTLDALSRTAGEDFPLSATITKFKDMVRVSAARARLKFITPPDSVD